MHLTVVAKAKKKQEKVLKITSDTYAVSVKEPPVDGRANEAIIKSLSKYFNIPRSQILLISGYTSKIKTFDVPDSLEDFEPTPTQKSLF